MGAKTGIEWTDSTWNPFIGCSRVSEGCRHCYAERLAGRFSAKTEGVYAGTTKTVNGLQVWTGKINRAPEETLLKPLHWKPVMVPVGPGGTVQELAPRPRLIFVNSMSDLFHESVPDEWIDQVFAVMALCPQHVFQVLTKRPERMLAYLGSSETARRLMEAFAAMAAVTPGVKLTIQQKADGLDGICFPNVWLGVSVEDQATADERIPLLLQTPAAVRFISAEPLLGSIKLPYGSLNVGPGSSLQRDQQGWCENGLDWVICGGESGPGARPMYPDWARSLRDQCVAAGVPYFFKQWGEWGPLMKGAGVGLDQRKNLHLWECGGASFRFGKKAAGALLDGREWKQFPEVQCNA